VSPAAFSESVVEASALAWLNAFGYQHAALKWVMAERMTNQSLRARFHLAEGRAATTSQVIAATIDAGFIKPDEAAGTSRKYARYLPFWA
jgi:hypothetical protein